MEGIKYKILVNDTKKLVLKVILSVTILKKILYYKFLAINIEVHKTGITLASNEINPAIWSSLKIQFQDSENKYKILDNVTVSS